MDASPTNVNPPGIVPVDLQVELPEDAPFSVVVRGEAVHALDPSGDHYDGRVMGWSPRVVVVVLRERAPKPGDRRDVLTLFARRSNGGGLLTWRSDGRGWSVRPAAPRADQAARQSTARARGDDLPW